MKLVNQFMATGEDGRSVPILVWQKMIEAGQRTIPGRKKMETEDGDHVNPNEDGTYEIVATGEILTSDDVNAERL